MTEAEVAGHFAVTRVQALQPVPEVHAEGDDLGHRSIAGVLDNCLFPAILQVVEPIDPLDDDALVLLAVFAEHVLDVQRRAGLAMVEGLPDSELGEHGRVREVELAAFGQAGDGGTGVGDDILHGLLPGVRVVAAKGTLGVANDRGEHGEQLCVPCGGGFATRVITSCTHQRSPWGLGPPARRSV